VGYDQSMSEYDTIREQYRPKHIKFLLVAESQPPKPEVGGSRHFYRTDKVRPDDRLYINTVRALYPETMDIKQEELEASKKAWLERFMQDGWYMIESLETSLEHEVTKKQRQELIKAHLPQLLERVRGLADTDTKIILIKSNVFDIAASPLKEAGFTVLNTELLDYPGRFNQRAYREKLARLAR
jgi:hypothetical protein